MPLTLTLTLALTLALALTLTLILILTLTLTLTRRRAHHRRRALRDRRLPLRAPRRGPRDQKGLNKTHARPRDNRYKIETPYAV